MITPQPSVRSSRTLHRLNRRLLSRLAGLLAGAVLLAVGGAATAQAADASGPVATVPQPTHDFGFVVADQRLTHTFTITNSGDEPLEIFKVRPGCGCTIANEHPKWIAPGDTGDFPFTLSTKRMKGKFSKPITVETNDPNNKSLRLTLTGQVQELINISPAFVQFGRVEPDQTQTRKVMITNKSQTPLELSIDSSSVSPTFQGELAEVIPGQQYELTVTATPPFNPNLNRFIMKFVTNLARQKSVEVVCMATLPSRIELQPPSLHIPAGLDRPQTRKIILTNNEAEPIKLLSADCEDKNLTVATRAIQEGRRYEIAVQVPTGYEFPDGGVALNLTTDDERQQRLAVPIQPIQQIGARMRQVRPEQKLVGQLAPRVILSSFDGQDYAVGQMEQPALLVFYASWCGFSKQAIPGFERLHRHYGDKGVQVLAINCDEPTGKLARTQEQSLDHYKSMALTMPLVLDSDGEIRARFNVSSFPTALLVSDQGVVEAVHVGSPTTMERVLANELDLMLAGKDRKDFPEGTQGVAISPQAATTAQASDEDTGESQQ